MNRKGLARSLATHGREQDFNNSDNPGTDQNHKDCWKNKTYQRKDQLDRRFGRRFFGDLTPFYAHGVRMDAQCLSETGTEAGGLNQNGHEIVDLRNSGAKRHVFKRVRASLPGPNFKIG